MGCIKKKKAALLETPEKEAEEYLPPESSLSLVGTEKEKYDDVSAELVCSFLNIATDVTSIDFSDNAITDKGGSVIADMLLHNTVLKTLILDRNLLSDGLAWIDVAKANTSVTTLSLRGNKIDDSYVDKVTSVIAFNSHPPQLKAQVLKLHARDSSSFDSLCVNCLLPEQLQEFTSQFPFADTRVAMRDSACLLLATQLRDCTHARLVSVSLAHNRIGDDGVQHLVEHFLRKKHAVITSLDLSHNWIGDTGATALATVLTTSADSLLAHLKLDHNSVSDKAAPALVQMMKANIRIEELSVSDNFLSYEIVQTLRILTAVNRKSITLKSAIVQALDNQPTTVAFDVQGLPSWDNEILPLCSDALTRNHTITSVNFSSNGISSDALAPVAAILDECRAVKEMNLAYNKIESVEKIVHVLKSSRWLATLNLSYNKIGDDDIWEFCKVLRENSTLTELNLSGNCFGRVGCRHLIEALKYNSSLKTLHMESMMDIDQDMLEEAQVAVGLFYGKHESLNS